MKPALLAALRYGRENAVTIERLSQGLGVSRRETEEAIEALRRDGAPICTGRQGCWLTESVEELKAQREALRRRARTILANSQGLRKAIAALSRVEPLTLWREDAA